MPHHSSLTRILEENVAEDEGSGTRRKRGRARIKPPKRKKFSPTDPEATLTTSCKQYRMEPSFKQHTAVDDKSGVVVDVEVTTGEVNKGRQLPEQIKRIEANTGRSVRTATADGSYGHGANYAMLEARGTEAIIPPQPEPKQAKHLPARRFKYDGRHQRVRCVAVWRMYLSRRT